MLTFKVANLGASTGFVLTKAAMARLRVRKGDTLSLTQAPDGGYRLIPCDPDFARRMALADAYACGLARNHGFADGKKRTAWVLARLFLMDNGARLRFDPVDAVRTMQAVAAGTRTESDLAGWFRARR
jgi:hypothetical protein